MIARIWTGTTRPTETGRYIAHLAETVVPELSTIEGYLGIYVLRRHRAGVDEFVVITLWQTLDAVRRFTGADVELAVVPPEAQALLALYDARATHYEVVFAQQTDAR